MMSQPIQPPDWQWLPIVLPHLQIVHHVQGRLRLRLLPSLLTVLPHISDSLFKAKLATLPGIIELRINKPAASLLITYDPYQIQSAWWERLLQASANDVPSLLVEIGLLHPLPSATSEDKAL
ncbi:hypothetical protein BegalDRAFT_0052 [Beggiatoa alba B18LD]|uniref:Uncharacterized protein n=1 Tax=Beggiatoa alba B18LD TaxID=395493 RepID=I3CBI5_9GAMM|nr:hypothetical protein [Beggiatoa alba]EIJ40978.1 hypothetical protein BegalDRAFT_0052 [Beggiatoa alba B18LD]